MQTKILSHPLLRLVKEKGARRRVGVGGETEEFENKASHVTHKNNNQIVRLT